MSTEESIEHGKLTVMGDIHLIDCEKEVTRHPLALLIEFDSVESIRKAIADGKVTFEFGEPS